MKKLTLSSQLLILIFSLLLVTSGLFMVISYLSISHIADTEVENKLSTAATILNHDPSSDNPDTTITICFRCKSGEQTRDENITMFLSEEEFNDLCEEACDSVLSQKQTSLYKTVNGVKVYYKYVQGENPGDYVFLLTDSSYTQSFIKSLFLRVFVSFTIIIFFAVTCIYAWSSITTKRIRNIQYHIQDLSKNKYQTSYVDDSLDEIGELSRCVEKMREEIGYNEKTKQDMLQNLSHDFKTPIAVIKSYAEALQDGMAGDEAINVIITQAEILKKKVNRLLQYNSLEYLKKDKPFEDVHMKELVERVVQNNRFQTSINFVIEATEDVVFPGYMENWTTVVENIIDNGKRFAKTEIRVTLKNGTLKIYNDGQPIDEQFLNSVFRPYEKGSKGEFGLGMSIVKKTVDFFGMNMMVKNEEYGGVSFIIKNPRYE